jgi:hypothetical protein
MVADAEGAERFAFARRRDEARIHAVGRSGCE